MSKPPFLTVDQCPLRYAMGVASKALSDYAPFSYRLAKHQEVKNIVGPTGWRQYWAVVDFKDRPYLMKRTARKAAMAAEECNYNAAREIMAGRNQQKT